MVISVKSLPLPSRERKKELTAQTAPTLDQVPAQQIKHRDEHHQHAKRGDQRNIMDTQETVAEPADHVDNWVQVRQPLPERRQQR